MATQIVLPQIRQTKGTVVYGLANIKSVAVGQVYINKDHLEQVNGEYPAEITLTIEPGDTTS